MIIRSAKIENYMLFEYADFEFSPNINVISGENSTGKTSLLKLLYACTKDISDRSVITNGKNSKISSLKGISPKEYGGRLPEKLAAVFGNKGIISLVDLISVKTKEVMKVSIDYNENKILSFTIQKEPFKYNLDQIFVPQVTDDIIYIPPKEMISSTENFAALYEEYQISFDETYYDLTRKLNRPEKKKLPDEMQAVLEGLESLIGGNIQKENQQFFLNFHDSGRIRMSLVADGYRKLATLYSLIATGTLKKGSILFWDEPETDMNPKMTEALVKTLLELSKAGIQIFVTTHDYFIQQYFGIAAEFSERYIGEQMSFKFFMLVNNGHRVSVDTAEQLFALQTNPVKEEFDAVYDREQSLIYE